MLFYLSGPIENTNPDVESFKSDVMQLLSELGFDVVNPSTAPIVIDGVPKTELELCELLKTYRRNKDLEQISRVMSAIRERDLTLLRQADGVIGVLFPCIPTCGTWEELILGMQLGKRVLVVTPKEKVKLPLWLFGMLPLDAICEGMEELKINLMKCLM